MTAALAPITRQTVGRTFIVAISILGIGAAVQLGVVGYLFALRLRQPVVVSAQPGGQGLEKESLNLDDVPGGAPPAPPRPVPLAPANTAIPSPEQVKQERFEEAVEHGKTLRARGDLYTAKQALEEAQAMNIEMDLKSPVPLGELALTYEKLGFTEPATQAWRQVYGMGETGGGVYYNLAAARLQLSQLQAVKDAQGKIAVPTPPPSTAGEKVGLTPEAKLGFMELKRRDENDPAAAKKFTLILPVRAKQKARIDVREVIVQVLFFDIVNGRALDKTIAQVSYKWTEPPADWGDGDVEQLEVTYALPNLRVADEERKYFGYIASVYYKNALQDFRADPPALAERYAPAKQLSSEATE
jgi:hypothetical protein